MAAGAGPLDEPRGRPLARGRSASAPPPRTVLAAPALQRRDAGYMVPGHGLRLAHTPVHHITHRRDLGLPIVAASAPGSHHGTPSTGPIQHDPFSRSAPRNRKPTGQLPDRHPAPISATARRRTSSPCRLLRSTPIERTTPPTIESEFHQSHNRGAVHPSSASALCICVKRDRWRTPHVPNYAEGGCDRGE